MWAAPFGDDAKYVAEETSVWKVTLSTFVFFDT